MTYEKPLMAVYDQDTITAIEALAKSTCCPTGTTNS